MQRVLDPAFWVHFWQGAISAVTTRGLHILLVLVLYWLARQVFFRAIDAAVARLAARRNGRAHTAEQANRLRTLQGLMRSIAGYVLLFVLLVMLLDAVGANVTGVITTAGVGGLAIGFGAQKLVRDVISGFFIMVEDQFAVGEYVTIGPATGLVEELGMRTTRVRDEQGRLWILSNGDISVVTNHSRAPVAGPIEVSVAASADVRQIEKLINEAGDALYRSDGHRLLTAPTSQGVSAFDAARTTLRVSVQAEPLDLAVEQMRVREAVRARLLAEGIPLA